MVIDLLRYANRQKVADALTERGYRVHRVTVNRWAAGAEMPEIAARMILELFGHSPDKTKEPPPEWARAMEERIRLELRLNRALIESDESEETRQQIAQMQAELHGQTPGEQPPDEGHPREDPRPRGTPQGNAL